MEHDVAHEEGILPDLTIEQEIAGEELGKDLIRNGFITSKDELQATLHYKTPDGQVRSAPMIWVISRYGQGFVKQGGLSFLHNSLQEWKTPPKP